MADMTMVEKVARAMCAANGVDPEAPLYRGPDDLRVAWQTCLPAARAAIAALHIAPSLADVIVKRLGIGDDGTPRTDPGFVQEVVSEAIDAILSEEQP